MKTYKCLVCGETFSVEDNETPVCPLCGVEGEDLELVENEDEAK